MPAFSIGYTIGFHVDDALAKENEGLEDFGIFTYPYI